MSKWLKIRDKIYQGKLREVNDLFEEVKNKIHDSKIPRYDWIAPLESWTNSQIKRENTSLRLSLQEFNHLKLRIDDLHNDFAQNLGCEDVVLEETQNVFIQDYTKILQSKENNLKLEIAAELIEEKQFPLEHFAKWYNAAHTLSPEKFNEELGNFWGDVWKHAAGGAGVGALAGSPGGLGGSFAGAGLGGLAGGLYGGASNLLKQVWQYRQTQRNFEQTKQKAVDALKKLKDLSQHFEMHPNFLSALDSMVNQLGSARAYRWAQSGQTPNASPASGKAVNPMKQPHPGWAELGKQATSSGPTASSVAPPTATPPVSPTTTAAAPPITPEAPLDPEEEKRQAELKLSKTIRAKKNFGHKLTPEEEQFEAGRQSKAKEEAERKALVAAAGSPSATASPPRSSQPEGSPGIKDKEDFIDLYKKVKGDPKSLAKLGMTLMNISQGERPEDFDANKFNHWFAANMTNYDLDDEDTNHAVKFVNDYVKKLGVEPTPNSPDESLGKVGTPTETPATSGNEPVEPQLKSDEELMGMSIKNFKQYAADLGQADFTDQVGMSGTHKRASTIELLKFHIKNKTESAFIRIGRRFKSGINLDIVPISERVEYIKALLRG